MERLTGYASAEALGQQPNLWLSPHTTAAVCDKVMSNLLTNAINYTLPGGQISVTTAVRYEQGQRMVFTVWCKPV